MVTYSFIALLPKSPYITVCVLDKSSRKTTVFELFFCTAELNANSQ